MPIIDGEFCFLCAEDEDTPVPAEHELDATGDMSGGGGFVCGNCLCRLGEAQDKRKQEAQ